MARTTPTPADLPDRDGSAEPDGNAIRGLVFASAITVVCLFAVYGFVSFCLTALEAFGFMPLP